MADNSIESREASQGEKMIEIKLRFWTNDIASEDGKIIPKHAQSGGVVRMERNKSHNIEPGKPRVFHTLLDVGAVIEKVLIEHGIVIHPGRTMSKYVQDRPKKTLPQSN
jgi:hypothetical protein